MEGTSGSVKQFKTYLSDAQKVQSMDNLEYWFDKKKGVTETQVKQKFQQMLCNNCNLPNVTQKTLSFQGGVIFDAIWSNQSLRESIWKPALYPSLTKIQAGGLFATIISNISSDFYKFINVK